MPRHDPIIEWAFDHKRVLPFDEARQAAYMPPESVILTKLRTFQISGSTRHLEDVEGILRISGPGPDQAYIELTGPRENAVRRFLPRFTHMFHVDEDAMARALVSELRIDMDAVFAVFSELEGSYTSDADDVALLYVRGVRTSGSPQIVHALSLHKALRQLLVDVMEAGWTGDDERAAIRYVQDLAS